MFITFEGCEGCGKTTHINLLADFLSRKGKEVLITREPGGTAFGEQLRDLLLAAEQKLSDRAELFLFAADRSQHVQKVIKPALERGKIVLSDRYVDSTYAYQIGGRQLPKEMVEYLIQTSSYGIMPKLTFFLDTDIDKGLSRVKERAEEITRFELQGMDFHKRVRESFIILAKENPKRIKVVDSSGTIDETQSKIRELVKEFEVS